MRFVASLKVAVYPGILPPPSYRHPQVKPRLYRWLCVDMCAKTLTCVLFFFTMLPKTPEHKSGIDLEARVGLAGFELGSGERQPPILDPTILPGGYCKYYEMCQENRSETLIY